MMTRRIGNILCLLILICLCVHPKIQSQVVDYTTKITISKGKKSTERHFVIQINNRSELTFSEIEVRYNTQHKFSLLKANIIDSNGHVVRKLRKKELVTKSHSRDGVFYQDDLITEFDLHWNDFPYRIEYAYKITEKQFFQIAHWYPVVYPNLETFSSTLQVEIPEDFQVAIDIKGNFEFEELYIGKQKLLTWSMGLQKSMDFENYSPPFEELLPRIIVVPYEFEYGVKGFAESWSSFGAWIEDLNEDTGHLPLSERTVVDKLIAGTYSKREKARILYHYLQDNTTYVNVSLDIGGLKSYPASYVSEKKYGDCKALTTYMKALLKHADIKSYYTIINAGTNAVSIIPEIPSQQFNHVVLAIPFDLDTVWLENTSDATPFNYLGTFTQNRYALLIDGHHSKLVRTPALSMSDVLEQEMMDIQLEEDGSGLLTSELSLRGSSFETFRYRQLYAGTRNLEKMILNDMAFPDMQLLEWKILEQDPDEAKIVFRVRGKITNQIREAGDMLAIKVPGIKIPELENPKERDSPVRVNYPIKRSRHIKYTIPHLSKFTVQLPDNYHNESEFGIYHIQYSISDSTIQMHEAFQLIGNHYNLSQYPEFYGFIETSKEIQSKSVAIFTP